MRILLVDAGNTRIKWAYLERGRLGRGRAATHSSWSAATYDRQLFGRARPAHVWATSVAGPGVKHSLAGAARRAGAGVTFVSVPRHGGGVRVGYPEPWRLGVDRFVAAVGAHALFPGMPLCVVGVGTAMTIDLIGADGRHRGGAIIPGPSLMVETLFKGTHGIQRRAQGGTTQRGRGLFARSTRDGVLQGGRYAAAALIDRAVDDGRALLGRRPLVVLTGGGGHVVRPLVRSACVGVPDLVLRGLAVLAQGGGREAGRVISRRPR
ncbi:MAG: type III pantothenate kinase [Gammaproteobacteria bacterium]|nr:type III pantothenate kinase [Gammaproteobacteria bacterium]MBV8306800.1 type III pantothenate kinase [Gammaproteobacteria bacterium]